MSRFGNNYGGAGGKRVCRALFASAFGKGTKARHHEEIRLYDVIIDRFDGIPLMRGAVAEAFLRKGTALNAIGLGREKGKAVFESLIGKFENDNDQSIVYIVSNAKSWLRFFENSESWDSLDRPEYDQLEDRPGRPW